MIEREERGHLLDLFPIFTLIGYMDTSRHGAFLPEIALIDRTGVTVVDRRCVPRYAF